MRPFIALVIAALLATNAFALVETTGSISMTNDDGALSAGVNPAGGISVTFLAGDSGGSSGGGGGGGGGDASVPQGPSTGHIFDKLEANKSYTLNIRSGQFIVRNITFTMLYAADTGASFTLSHILDIHTELVPPLGQEYDVIGYERLDYTGIYKSMIAPGVKISFSIPKTNFSPARGSPEKILLVRYDGVNWNELPTAYITENSLEYSYNAVSPGLSVFAFAIKRPPVATNTTAPPVTGGVISTPSTPTNNGASTASGGSAGTAAAGAETNGATVPAKPVEYHALPWISILIVIILGGALIGYYYYDRGRRIEQVNAVAEGELKKAQEQPFGIASISEDAFGPAVANDPVEQLRSYVDNELRQGLHREVIAAQLRSTGWPENIVSSVLDDFSAPYLAQRGMAQPHDDYTKLLEFLKEKLDHGYDIGVVKSGLVKAGWDATLVEGLLRDLQRDRAAQTASYSAEALAQLRAFIANERKHGHTKEQVRAALLGVGWQARVVDEELAKAP